jgi:phosphoserine phosphatase RsbU/P
VNGKDKKMVAAIEPVLHGQLLERRGKLEAATSSFRETTELRRLLAEVDAALWRMEEGSYGICEVCHDGVETERLIADPLTRFCLDHLTPPQQRALEDDLELASQIQRGLLPHWDFKVDGWEIAYFYQPAGLVSGDYCDLITADNQSLYFILGDVSGKGVAASMLMAHLHALFRTLTSINLPLDQLLERASRVFCESTLPTHYATLVFGKANTSGQLEICNAGHLPALLVQERKVDRIEATGLPVGVFSSEHFLVDRLQMQKSETIFLYTDGVSESRDLLGNEYGIDRLSRLLSENHNLPPRAMVDTCVRDLVSFRKSSALTDDLTVMAIQRTR